MNLEKKEKIEQMIQDRGQEFINQIRQMNHVHCEILDNIIENKRFQIGDLRGLLEKIQ